MEVRLDGYTISDDRNLLQIERVQDLFSRSYWAAERPLDTIARSIEHSICYGVYHDGAQVGFARAVTDYATVFWLCDVIIDNNHCGRGLGKALVAAIVEDPRLAGLTGILGTRDAHSLYERFGFARDTEGRFMRKRSGG